MRTWGLSLALLVIPADAWATPLAPSDCESVLRETARLIETRYVDPAKAQKLARELRKSARLWCDNTNAEGFAMTVTEWLKKTSSDGHFALDYSATEIAENGNASSFNDAEMLKWYGPQINHGVEKD